MPRFCQFLLFALIFYGIGIFFPWHFLMDIAGPMDIALFHTCFNLSATAVLLPASRLLEKLAYLTIPAEAVHQKPVLLDERLLATPAAAILRAKEIAAEMAQTALDAMKLAIGLTKNFDAAVLEQVKQLEDKTDIYEDALGSYLVKLTGTKLSSRDNKTLNTLLYSISDIERIADHAVAVAKAGEEMQQKNIRFSLPAQQELQVLERALVDTIAQTVNAFAGDDLEEAIKIEPREQVVDSLVKEVKTRHVLRLRDGLCSVEYGFVLEDLLTAYERCADHCSNVAVEMLQVAEGKLEAHEYLNALKSGELRQSAQYADLFRTYRNEYALPSEPETT